MTPMQAYRHAKQKGWPAPLGYFGMGYHMPLQEVTVPQVIIRHPKTGAEYEIASGDFRRGKHYADPKSGDMVTFEQAGFEIVSLPNGEPYDGPLNDPPAERAVMPKD